MRYNSFIHAALESRGPKMRHGVAIRRASGVQSADLLDATVQQIFLIILALLVTTQYVETARPDALPARTMLLGFGGITLSLLLLGLALCRWSVWRLRRREGDSDRFITWLTRWQGGLTLATFGAHFAWLQYWNWGGWLRAQDLIADWDVLIYLAGIAPLVFWYQLRWITQAPFEREAQGADWSLQAYLRFRSFPLLPLAPLMIFTLLADLSGWLPETLRDTFTYRVPAVLVLMLFLSAFMVSLFPYLLKWLFGCRPLPPGALRDDFEALIKRSGVRCRDILVWPMRGMRVPNAMMTGLLPGLRFVFVTDSMLQHLPHQALLGVFAHELGHGKHNHLAYLLAFVFTFMFMFTVAFGVSDFLFAGNEVWQVISLLGLAGLFWGGAFGYLMRRFERQADLYAARLTGSSFGIVSGLHCIRALAETHRKLPAFFHFSIEDRVRFLHSVDLLPDVESAFQKTVRGLKAGLLAAVALFGCLHYPLHKADVTQVQLSRLHDDDHMLPPERFTEALELRRTIARLNPFDLNNRCELGLLLLAIAEKDHDAAKLEEGKAELRSVKQLTPDHALYEKADALLLKSDLLRFPPQ